MNVRTWALACDTLYVVTGAMIQTKEDPQIKYVKDNNGNQVALPKLYYKVLLRYKASEAENGGYSGVGFWYENRAYTASHPVAADARSIKEMEALTGLDFFHNLPPAVKETVKAAYKPEDWEM